MWGDKPRILLADSMACRALRSGVGVPYVSELQAPPPPTALSHNPTYCESFFFVVVAGIHVSLFFANAMTLRHVSSRTACDVNCHRCKF